MTTKNVDGARAFHCGIFLHDDAAPDFVAMAARQTQLAWLGFHRVELLSRALFTAAHPRARYWRASAQPRRAVRVQPCVTGRYPRDRFDCAGRLCRQTRGRGLAVGITAKAQRTVFVDRTRRHQTSDAVDEIVKRMENGVSVVLFAEGTSSDGNRVLPFRSALLGAVEEAAGRGGVDSIVIQPMSICYTGQHGIPMGRQHRPLVAWYGDLEFMPHIKAFIEQGAVDASVTYGEPVTADRDTDRKAMTKRLEDAVRRLLAAALRGRPLAAESVT